MSETNFHATTVAFGDAGVMILGPSGAGKSALGLELMSRGAQLVSDDRSQVQKTPNGALSVHAPERMAGLIEARFVGLLKVPHLPRADLRLVVDLSQVETERLPPPRHMIILGDRVDCLYRVDGPHFPASIVALIQGGRQA